MLLAEVGLQRARRDTCRSRDSAFSLICRTRSRVMPSSDADLLERHRLLAVEPEVQAQNLRLALLQVRQRLLDRTP